MDDAMTLLEWLYIATLGGVVINGFMAAINKDAHSFCGWLMALAWFMHSVALQCLSA